MVHRRPPVPISGRAHPEDARHRGPGMSEPAPARGTSGATTGGVLRYVRSQAGEDAVAELLARFPWEREHQAEMA